jgi:hypothetical protein
MPVTPSLVTRIAVGKLAGLAIGAAGYAMLPMFAPEAPQMLRWGVMLWYLTLGGLIGVAGVMTRHPVLRIPLPWWLTATALGAWMNFVLTLMIHDQAAMIAAAAFGAGSPLANPFWLVLEGAIVGLFIGWLAHLAGGEGPETVGR